MENFCVSLQVLKYRALMTDERFDEKVINLISGDMNKIDYALATAHEIYRAPLEAFFIGIFVYRESGAAGLLGMLLMLSSVPLLCELLGVRTSLFSNKIMCSNPLSFSSVFCLHKMNRKFFMCSLYWQKVVNVSLAGISSYRAACQSHE